MYKGINYAEKIASSALKLDIFTTNPYCIFVYSVNTKVVFMI